MGMAAMQMTPDGINADDFIRFVFSLLDEHAVKRIKACEPELRELFDKSKNKRRTQRVVLEAVATLVTGPKHGEELLKKTPAILMALYEIDLLEEPEVVKWHAGLSADDEGSFHSVAWREKVREAAKPFIEWLEKAEEESSEEESHFDRK